jgi:hypothetical protein
MTYEVLLLLLKFPLASTDSSSPHVRIGWLLKSQLAEPLRTGILSTSLFKARWPSCISDGIASEKINMTQLKIVFGNMLGLDMFDVLESTSSSIFYEPITLPTPLVTR